MIQNRVTEILFRNFFLFLLKFILTNDRYYYLLCHRHYFKSFTHINSCNLLKFQEVAIVIPPPPPPPAFTDETTEGNETMHLI